MVVTVLKDLYGNGKQVKASDLTLGSQLCGPSFQREDSVVFQNGLQECGIQLQMSPDFVIYSTEITYKPTPLGNAPIVRTNDAVTIIKCYYPRHGNVSSDAIKPTWVPFISTISVEEKLVFSLQLMNDDWSAPETSMAFQLGDIFHIEASVDIANHVPMMVFVDRCVATLSPDTNSNPRYDIIDLNGCLLDGKQEDSSSAFRPQRPQPNQIQFTVDAFRFSGIAVSTIYITCNLRAVPVTQTPDRMNKACSFSKITNTWSPLEGTSNICICCDTGNCAVPDGQSRRMGSYAGRRHWKRKAGLDHTTEQGLVALGPLMVVGPSNHKEDHSEQGLVALGPLVVVGPSNHKEDHSEQGLVALGPLMVVGPSNHKEAENKAAVVVGPSNHNKDENKAAAIRQEPIHLEVWVLVTITSLSLAVLVACAAVIVKYVFKK
ncbi:zona pellucida sperm-binding protein 3-like [Bombina bombina]|uniref:zona pellucida sperm-binding protein 3-like n=1 Tax=Bombina bombina TaxID=8345 RepID=UPI00235AD693|nr:zona pellucida sperm-binding protein 3-like [Bombina bombina]